MAIQIAKDQAFQLREWRVQHHGKWAMTLFLAAAILGLMGNVGPLSRTEVSVGETAIVDWPRITRQGSRATLTVNALSGEEGLSVWFDKEFLRSVRVERISPQPDAEVVAQDRIIYSFRALRDEEVVIQFSVIPERAGIHANRFGIFSDESNGNSVKLRRFVLP